MLNINPSRTVPALVRSGNTSTASISPSSTAPATPNNHTKSLSSFLPPNKKSSMAGLKTKLSKFRRSTKSLLSGTAKSKPFLPCPTFSVTDKIFIEQGALIKIDAALLPRYQEAAVTETQRYMHIPLPCPPSQISLIPLYDGHSFPSPAAEHDTEHISSHNFPAGLAEQALPTVGPGPTPSPAAAATPPPQISKALRVHRLSPPVPRFSKRDKTCFSASERLTYRRRPGVPPLRQSYVDSHRSLSPSSIPAVPQQPSSKATMTHRLSRTSHLSGSLFFPHSHWMLSYTVMGIVMTAGFGYYYASVFS